MESLLPWLQALKEYLEQSDWFREEEWICQVNQADERNNFTLRKPRWSSHGLSFASWIGGHELRSKNFKIAHYLEPVVRQRAVFSKRLAETLKQAGEELGYRVCAKYDFILFKKFKPLHPSTVVESMARELVKLRQAAMSVDATIKEFEIELGEV